MCVWAPEGQLQVYVELKTQLELLINEVVGLAKVDPVVSTLREHPFYRSGHTPKTSDPGMLGDCFSSKPESERLKNFHRLCL